MTTILPGRPGKPIVVDVEGSPSVTVRQGVPGPAGPAGVGVPTGGTTGQALVKTSNTDYETGWGTAVASAAWGAITGTLSAQTDLQSALDAKQATLVSATNIKTVNGNTLLGSGDLVVSGGLSDGDKGDITVSGSGANWIIDAGAVTLAKQADMATSSLVYRKTAGSGVPEINTLATLKTDLGLTGTNSGDQTITLTSDVTGSGTGSFAATIAAGAVSLSKMANVATGTVFYRKTAATGVPEVQPLATLKTDLGLTGTNSGDQTSIVGITGTLAQFNTAVTDADLATTTAANTFTGIQTIPALNLSLQSVATAGATTTLTSASPYQTRFTGTLTQTLVLPNATTLAVGHRYLVSNNSTGAVTVQTNGGATLWIVAGTTTDLDLTLTDNSTAAGAWDLDYRVGSSASGKSSQFNNSFTFNGTDGTTFTFPTTSGTLPLNTVFTSGANGLAPASGGGTTNFLRADGTWAAAGGGSPITVQDEGSNITTALGTLNFVGAGVTVTGGATAVVTIPGGGGGLSDGDYGEVTVSGTGTVIRVNPKIKFGLPLAMRRSFQF